MRFYALEEDCGYEIPVVFVPGIAGSPRDFAEIVAGRRQPFHPTQVQFLAACRGERPGRQPAGSAWLKLGRDQPHRLRDAEIDTPMR